MAAVQTSQLVGKRPATIDHGPWQFSDRPRVLIEHPDPDTTLELAVAIRREGFGVGVCTGPAQIGDRPMRCPLHKLEPCVAVEGADVVVTILDLEDEAGIGVLRGLRTRYPSKPLVVAATVAQSLELEDTLEGCTVVPVNAEPDEIVAAVCNAFTAA